MKKEAVILILLLALIASCARPATTTPETPAAPVAPSAQSAPPVTVPDQPVQLANPATVSCKDKGYETRIITAADGSQYGECDVKTDVGTFTCDEWQHFRGECPTCAAYCAKKPTGTCVGNWRATGSHPNCSCEWTCRNLSVGSAAVNDTFVSFYLPWPKGDTWDLTTDLHDTTKAYDFGIWSTPKSKLPMAPVLAPADGEVLFANYRFPNSFSFSTSIYPQEEQPVHCGNTVILKHNDNTFTFYCHLQYEASPPLSMGNKIKRGQRIGYEGNTGFTVVNTGTHLHFAVLNSISVPQLDMAALFILMQWSRMSSLDAATVMKDADKFPKVTMTPKPRDKWGFVEWGNSSTGVLNRKYTSQNPGTEALRCKDCV